MAECIIQMIGERQIVSAASLQVNPLDDILNNIHLSRASTPSMPMGWQEQSRAHPRIFSAMGQWPCMAA